MACSSGTCDIDDYEEKVKRFPRRIGRLGCKPKAIEYSQTDKDSRANLKYRRDAMKLVKGDKVKSTMEIPKEYRHLTQPQRFALKLKWLDLQCHSSVPEEYKNLPFRVMVRAHQIRVQSKKKISIRKTIYQASLECEDEFKLKPGRYSAKILSHDIAKMKVKSRISKDRDESSEEEEEEISISTQDSEEEEEVKQDMTEPSYSSEEYECDSVVKTESAIVGDQSWPTWKTAPRTPRVEY